MPFELSPAQGQTRAYRGNSHSVPLCAGSLGAHGREVLRTRDRSSRITHLPSLPSRNDREALHELFRTSRERYIGIAYRILRNRQDAEDAVQDAFFSAHRYYRDFEGRAAVTTWLTRIVMNAALMVRRKRATCSLDSIPETDFDPRPWTETAAAPGPDPEFLCANQEAQKTIHRLLNQMPPLLRQAFVMTCIEELSLKESSTRLGVPLSTFKARVFRAKRLLKGKMKTQFSGLPRKTIQIPMRFHSQAGWAFLDSQSRSLALGFDSSAGD